MNKLDKLYIIDLDDTIIKTTENIKPIVATVDEETDLSKIKDDSSVFSDAFNFFQRISNNDNIIIYSYGKDVWQRKKYQTLLPGSKIPMIVVSSRDKSIELAKCYDKKNQCYQIGDYNAKSIVLIDDNKLAFSSFDKLINARGYWLDRGYQTQNEEIPAEVKTIKSLDEIAL